MGQHATHVIKSSGCSKVASHVEASFTKDEIEVGEEVTLTWKYYEYQPTDGDYLAYFCSSDILHEQADHKFLDYRYLTESEIAEGAGILTIPSLRSGRKHYCEFRFFSNEGCRVGSSQTITINDASTAVTQLHLALTGVNSEMRVSWTSGGVNISPTVRWGDHTGALTSEAVGTCWTYKQSDMCEAPATTEPSFVEPGWLCTAVMTSLSPDTTYYYKVTSDAVTFSDTISFVSAPPLDDPDYNFSFIAYGDMGTWSHVKNASAAVATAKISTSQVLSGARRIDHFGDISYAKGVSGTWDAWFDLIEPYASKVPYMVTIGNHEFDYVSGGENDPSINSINPQPAFKPDWWQSASDSGGECGVPMHNRFTMPSNPLSNGIFWYSFDYANTHTIMLSSEHNCTEGSPQYKFLESDLEGVDRKKTPWVFVEFHRPMYNREDSASYEIALGMQSEFEPILLKYEVDLVLAGHFHSYLRTSRVANDKRDEENGIVHITVGSAGASLDTSDGCSELEWTEYFTQNWGVGKVTVENRTHVKWEFIENHDDHNHGAVVDETWIIKRQPNLRG